MDQTSPLSNIRSANSITELLSYAELPSLSETFDEAINESSDATPHNDAESMAMAVLEGIEKLYPNKPIKTAPEEAQAKALQSYLTGAYCTAWNRHYKDAYKDKVQRLLEAIQKRLINYTKRQLIKDPETSLICRYLVASLYYPGCNQGKLLSIVNERGYLLKETHDNGGVSFFIRGLAAKVGDNTFSIDRRGREHRQYLTVTVPQAFPVYTNGETYTMSSHDFIKSVPELDSAYYHITSFGDRKGCARHFPVQWHKVPDLLRKLSCY
ncbi:MAG: hypothetical protein CMF12_08640 [Idiomarina sp.]|uniref:hypothetical protein n=1 Tax=Idiomarina sp. TaxID=1874361 RepID=UPI000C580A5A|nr:hypothetical protein [Idiomarina sp.]MBT42577.1 hypothetical protein [Idiomarina sp.]